MSIILADATDTCHVCSNSVGDAYKCKSYCRFVHLLCIRGLRTARYMQNLPRWQEKRPWKSKLFEKRPNIAVIACLARK